MKLKLGFFAYPRKKVQSRFVSWLVNDHLPLDAQRFSARTGGVKASGRAVRTSLARYPATSRG